MAFVPSSAKDQSDTAKLLLAMAAEAGMHPRVIQVVKYGFRVPDELLVVDGVPVLVPVDDFVQAVFPDSEDKPLIEDEAEVVVVPDSPAVDSAEPGLEEMRDWARANGYQVADRGKLKNAVVEAFRAAHSS